MGSRRRGNLLLSALFMAAFLFFLSVALVVTNREDIRYTLFVDHRMRASLAAEGMLDYSLTVMRETQDWEGKLQSWRPGFASGAIGEIKAKFWSSAPPPADSGRYSVPPQGTITGVELIASATSGLFRSERHLLLEEFRFADSLLASGGKPHLFALIGNGMQVLTPSFTWESVGPLPTTPLPLTVSAGGEQVHYLAPCQGVKPPVIQDFSKISVAGIYIPSAEMTSSGVPQIPVGHGGSVLVLKEGSWSWDVLPDPGEQLGTVVQPAIEAADPAAGSSGSFDQLTLDWDEIARTPSELTVPYEYFNGPRVNWYSLTGTRAEVSNGTYICHGLHYFYSGFRFKNTPTGDGRTQSQGKDNSLFEEPCLLKYTVKTKKWEVVIDFLKVQDMLEEPLIVQGTRPNPSTLLVADGHIYSQAADAVDKQWYEVTKERLQIANLPKRDALFPYNGDWLYCDPRLPNPLTNIKLNALNRFDIAPYFPSFLPVLNPNGPYDAQNSMTGGMEPPMDLYWDIKESSLTGYSKDLFCIATLTSLDRAPTGGSAPAQTAGLAHFDGQRWQILPAGLAFLLNSKSSFRREMALDYAGGAGPAVGATRMVLGGYPTDKPLLRRYVPVARWGPN